MHVMRQSDMDVDDVGIVMYHKVQCTCYLDIRASESYTEYSMDTQDKGDASYHLLWMQ